VGTVDRQDEIRGAVARLLTERTVLGEDYGFDIGPALVPAAQGAAAGYLLVVSCRSPVLVPPRMASAQVIADSWPGEDALAAAVGTCLDVLAQMRAKLLEVPAPAAANGMPAGLTR
jgi:hypothetical protein